MFDLRSRRTPIAAFDPCRAKSRGTANVTGSIGRPTPIPSISLASLRLPCRAGSQAEGLPVGLQIVGARYRDDLVLRAAHAYQIAAPTARPDAARFVSAERQ
jgi:aspartyl-tRNA(Asn)/glutamyl-tRNA(Gln) amidotransferase subunit A